MADAPTRVTRWWRGLSLGSAALVLVAVAGCVPDDGPPPGPPSPSSTDVTTPPTSPTPSPTMPSEADKQAAINAYVEANKIVDDVLINGGADTLPEEIEKYATTTGSYYKYESSGVFEAKALGTTFSERTKVIESDTTAVDRDRLKVFVCVDARHVTIEYKHIEPRPGVLVAGYVFAERSEDGWRVTDYELSDGLKEVATCGQGR
ncbi:hypothetical protein ACQBAU_12345 [Propionibacteriaceae bacterium Y2011]